jgi:hypothetical protein
MFLEREEFARLWQGGRQVFLVTQRSPTLSVIATLPPGTVYDDGLYGSRHLFSNRPQRTKASSQSPSDHSSIPTLWRQRCLEPERDRRDVGG